MIRFCNSSSCTSFPVNRKAVSFLTAFHLNSSRLYYFLMNFCNNKLMPKLTNAPSMADTTVFVTSAVAVLTKVSVVPPIVPTSVLVLTPPFGSINVSIKQHLL